MVHIGYESVSPELPFDLGSTAITQKGLVLIGRGLVVVSVC